MTRPNVPADEDLGARFRPIFQRIAREAVRREQQRELPFEAIQWLREAGFGAIRVPQAYGGDGATIAQLFRLLVELAEADSNIPQILRAHFAFVEGRLNSKEATDVKAFRAQQIVIDLVLEATTLLFEVGGASATSETRRLDRYWRNARTLASHNPAIYRERAIGDYYLNGTDPRESWFARQSPGVITRGPVSEPLDELAGG